MYLRTRTPVGDTSVFSSYSSYEAGTDSMKDLYFDSSCDVRDKLLIVIPLSERYDIMSVSDASCCTLLTKRSRNGSGAPANDPVSIPVSPSHNVALPFLPSPLIVSHLCS